MPQEIELKAVVPDAAEMRGRLEAAGAELRFAGTMHDRRYDRGGELSAADQVLRVRTWVDAAGRAEHQLAWKGATGQSEAGYKVREERECRITGEPAPDAILEALGYELVHRIDRRVELFELMAATARLETYPFMDVLMEVEGTPDGIEGVILASGLPRSAFTADPLAVFVADFERRGNGPARLAESP